MIMPFDGVIDGEWPQELLDWSKQYTREFVTYTVPKYAERYDFRMLRDNSPILFMEAKNRTKPIGNMEFATILTSMTENGTPQILFVIVKAFTKNISHVAVCKYLREPASTILRDYAWTRLVRNGDNQYRLHCLKNGSMHTIVLLSLVEEGIVIA